MGFLKYAIFGLIVSAVLLYFRFKKQSQFIDSIKTLKYNNLVTNFTIIKVFGVFVLLTVLDILFWPAEIFGNILKNHENKIPVS